MQQNGSEAKKFWRGVPELVVVVLWEHQKGSISQRLEKKNRIWHDPIFIQTRKCHFPTHNCCKPNSVESFAEMVPELSQTARNYPFQSLFSMKH